MVLFENLDLTPRARVYAAAIAATLIGRPELRYSIAHFA